ncbi:MAG: hypothetical protein WC246_00745 [Candidatus Paceibacterota bacterium]|jgi:hypothetical protein
MEIFGVMFSFLFFLVVVVGLFLVFRFVALWYWKIDKIVDRLEKIERNTRSPKTAAPSSENASSDQAQQEQVVL